MGGRDIILWKEPYQVRKQQRQILAPKAQHDALPPSNQGHIITPTPFPLHCELLVSSNWKGTGRLVPQCLGILAGTVRFYTLLLYSLGRISRSSVQ